MQCAITVKVKQRFRMYYNVGVQYFFTVKELGFSFSVLINYAATCICMPFRSLEQRYILNYWICRHPWNNNIFASGILWIYNADRTLCDSILDSFIGFLDDSNSLLLTHQWQNNFIHVLIIMTTRGFYMIRWHGMKKLKRNEPLVTLNYELWHQAYKLTFDLIYTL